MILGVSRKDDQNAFGLPGGKVNEYESESQAARRELFEETGIVLIDFPGMKEIFRRESGVTFQILTSRIANVSVRNDDETGLVAWVTPEQLMTGPFGGYNRQLLTHIGRV